MSLHSVTHSAGSKRLFVDLSLGVDEGDRIGLIGRNGSGKSTLLKLVGRQLEADQGEVSWKKGLRLVYIDQDPEFVGSQSAASWLKSNLRQQEFVGDIDTATAVGLSMVGFDDHDRSIQELSGGWKKRLQIAAAVAMEPELLVLDEPTNHLDWDGILWLESWLKSFPGTLLVVSHDRQFLHNVSRTTVELSQLYEDGYLRAEVPYFDFLPVREKYRAEQMDREKRLANKVRRETEWLRAGVKARTTKSQSRIDKAHELIEEHQSIKGRNIAGSAKSTIKIDRGSKKSKKLIELKGISVSYGANTVFRGLDLTLSPGQTIGILGDNGSGKTSLLKVLAGTSNCFSGDVSYAEGVQTVYFDQSRDQLPGDQNIMEFLSDGGEYVVYRNQSVHVASYASRFLFESEKLRLPIRELSGGEQARLLIAKLLLSPADIVILDEPTNDLDIETIGVLEESLEDFSGAVVLVSHDRSFLERLCDSFLGLEGLTFYAELRQWLKARRSKVDPSSKPVSEPGEGSDGAEVKSKEKTRTKKLSYKEKKRYEVVESEILACERRCQEIETEISLAGSDHIKLSELTEELNKTNAQIESLYEEWNDLESRQG